MYNGFLIMVRSLAIFALLLIIGTGCAVSSLDHMCITNLIDRKIVPDNKTVQWIMTPVLVPACAVTLTIDNFIVAPIVQIPSVYGDIREYWKADVKGYYAGMGILPIRVALTPVVFLGSWFGRTVFGIEPRENARWGWPKWGMQWVRDEDGKILGPPWEFDPVLKEPIEDKDKEDEDEKKEN